MKSFVPILAKQVPYAVGQFTVNEWAHETVNKSLGKERVEAMGGGMSTVVNLGCGVVAVSRILAS
jgi:solute carrier family 25 phosphate transporter 3